MLILSLLFYLFLDKQANEILITRQLTKELVVEKLLSLIDLPIVEKLLTFDYKTDIEYLKALEKTPVSGSKKSASNSQIPALSILNETYDLAKCEM